MKKRKKKNFSYASYYAFMDGISRCKRRRRGSQANFNSSVTDSDRSSCSNSNSKGLDSLEDSDFGDEEEDEEEE